LKEKDVVVIPLGVEVSFNEELKVFAVARMLYVGSMYPLMRN